VAAVSRLHAYVLGATDTKFTFILVGSVDTAQSAVADRPHLLVADLGWTRDEAAAVRAQFGSFAEDWDAPEMDAYDAL
jgi:hypothetical protein